MSAPGAIARSAPPTCAEHDPALPHRIHGRAAAWPSGIHAGKISAVAL